MEFAGRGRLGVGREGRISGWLCSPVFSRVGGSLGGGRRWVAGGGAAAGGEALFWGGGVACGPVRCGRRYVGGGGRIVRAVCAGPG